MGRKKQAGANSSNGPLPQDFDLSAFCRALREMMRAASSRYLGDCFTHVSIAQRALSRLDINAELCVGYAGWRVAKHSLINHDPKQGTHYHVGSGGEGKIFHTWLMIANRILDPTTYQLPEKAETMDRMDGQITPVDWAPDYLWVTVGSCSTYDKVRDSYKKGVYYYRRDRELETEILASALPGDPSDETALLLLYEQYRNGNEVAVLGPNSFATESSA